MPERGQNAARDNRDSVCSDFRILAVGIFDCKPLNLGRENLKKREEGFNVNSLEEKTRVGYRFLCGFD